MWQTVDTCLSFLKFVLDMGLVSVDLNNVNLDDYYFDDDNLETIIY